MMLVPKTGIVSFIGTIFVTIGERLKEERQLIRLNQTDLAEQCGVSKNTQLAYEKGERSPDAAYLAKAAALEMDVLYVVTGERKPLPNTCLSSDPAAFFEVYQQVSESDREVLFRTAQAFAKSR